MLWYSFISLIKIFYCSIAADIFFSTKEFISFSYNCTTTKSLLGITDQLYKVSCYPVYYMNRTFLAHNIPDAATILCKKTSIDGWGITWATPCNNIQECDNGNDETGCEFPIWLIPCLLSVAGALLFISLFVYLDKSIRSSWKKKMRYRKSRLSIPKTQISTEAEKLYKIAVLIESGEIDNVHKMYVQEVENNGGEGEATCNLKVIERPCTRNSKALKS